MSSAQYHEAIQSDDVGQKLAVAQRETDPDRKNELLQSVIDTLVKDKTAVLDNYQDEICQFCTDDYVPIRVSTIRFIFHAVSVDIDSITTLSTTICQMLNDSYFLVITQTLIYLIKMIYSMKHREKFEMPIKEALLEILATVQSLLSHDNDGIRTQTVRSIESFCTLPHECRPLVDSAKESIKNFLKEPHITSGNIVTGLMSLSRLAKSDLAYLPFMVNQYESIHSNLPPTLSVTQVQNVRKVVKIQLLDILRTLPNSQPFHSNIYQLLSDFNVSKKEFEAAIQAATKDGLEKGKSEKRKRTKEDRKEEEKPSKRPKSSPEVTTEKDRIDDLSKKIQPQLTIDNVIDLVIKSMNMLPDKMPASFSATYTPIQSAGTEPQKEHLARMLASQMVAAGSVSGPTETKKTEKSGSKHENEKQLYSRQKKERARPDHDRTLRPEKMQIQKVDNKISRQPRQEFNLAKTTKPIKNKLEMARFAAEHLAKGGKKIQNQTTRHLMLTRIVSHYGGSLSNIVADIIDQSRTSRMDLSLCWLYAEYAHYVDTRDGDNDIVAVESYDCCIQIILSIFADKKCLSMMAQTIKQAPLLTKPALLMIRDLCQEEENAQVLLKTCGEITLQRRTNRMNCMSILLEFANHYNTNIRIWALDQIVSIYSKLYSSTEINNLISTYLEKFLQYLKYETPPEELSNLSEHWPEDLIERCLALALAILPRNANVLRDLAQVYAKSKSADVQKTIMRALDAPVRQLDQTNPDLLNLITNCPDYCESFITRVLHIITDKTTCSTELVDAVRTLMKSKQMDVRFLIPVLGALTKTEVVDALPELITLHKSVVKDVFYRLLGVQKGHIASGIHNVAPLTAVELLLILHTMEGISVKPSMEAISLCGAEKQVFTFEVFASAIDEMLKLDKLPTLFMRTVLQALITHPRMASQIVNTLVKLIGRKVWEMPKMWDGFVMCCQRLKAKCVTILLQLPEEALLKIIQTAPDLNSYLASHLDSLDQAKRSKIDSYFKNVVQQQQQQTLTA